MQRQRGFTDADLDDAVSAAVTSLDRRIAQIYPIEVWRLGDLTWIFLGSETVVDYSQMTAERKSSPAGAAATAWCRAKQECGPGRCATPCSAFRLDRRVCPTH